MTTDQICLAISTFAAVVFAFMYYKAMADSKHFKLENQQQRKHGEHHLKPATPRTLLRAKCLPLTGPTALSGKSNSLPQ